MTSDIRIVPSMADDSIEIEARDSAGFSQGVITIDDTDSLVLLRDELDYYLSTFKPNHTMSKKKISPLTTVINGYLNGEYKPVPAYVPGSNHRLLSSQEIVTELSEMIDMDVNDVAAVMTALGYTVARDGGKTGWVLAPAD